MSEVIAARKAYEQAQKDARALIEHARLNLGRAIQRTRQREVKQKAIGEELSLTREQLRRFQQEYEDAIKRGEYSPAEVELARRIVGVLVEGVSDEALVRALAEPPA
jgi:hypothetical protein